MDLVGKHINYLIDYQQQDNTSNNSSDNSNQSGAGAVNQYYQMIMDRLLDRGVSVRKRVVKILRDISLRLMALEAANNSSKPNNSSNSNSSRNIQLVSQIASRLVSRISDENSIKVIIILGKKSMLTCACCLCAFRFHSEM